MHPTSLISRHTGDARDGLAGIGAASHYREVRPIACSTRCPLELWLFLLVQTVDHVVVLKLSVARPKGVNRARVFAWQ